MTYRKRFPTAIVARPRMVRPPTIAPQRLAAPRAQFDQSLPRGAERVMSSCECFEILLPLPNQGTILREHGAVKVAQWWDARPFCYFKSILPFYRRL